MPSSTSVISDSYKCVCVVQRVDGSPPRHHVLYGSVGVEVTRGREREKVKEKELEFFNEVSLRRNRSSAIINCSALSSVGSTPFRIEGGADV